MGLIPQKEKETKTKDEIQISEEENTTDDPMEKQVPENINNYEDADPTEMRESEEEANLPIKGSIKWEKPRTSARVTKNPDRWGNNIMISKIEKESQPEEESLPSVIEIQNPNSL